MFPSRGNHRRGKSSALLTHRKPRSLHIRGCIGTRLQKNSHDFLQKSEQALRFPSRRLAHWGPRNPSHRSPSAPEALVCTGQRFANRDCPLCRSPWIPKGSGFRRANPLHNGYQALPDANQSPRHRATGNELSRFKACHRVHGVPGQVLLTFQRHSAGNRSRSGNLTDSPQRFLAAFCPAV